MRDVIVRLAGITIQNFKNVVKGTLSFENNRKDYKSSILGLYGQNGSGKTALIEAMELLQHILCGRPVPAKFADFINVDSETAALAYEFEIQLPQGTYNVSYEASFKKEKDTIAQNTEQTANDENQYRVVIFNEVVKTLILSTTGKNRIGKLIDTDTDEVFLPRPKVPLLVGRKKETKTNLLVARKLTEASSRSFIFSRELLTAIREQVKKSTDEELLFYSALLEALVKFGNMELFVVNTTNSGLISLNAQPLMFKFEGKNMGAIGTVMLPLETPVVIPQKMLGVVKEIIRNMNIVLKQIIPGLTISVKELGTQLMDGEQIGARIQLMSRKNSKEIALKHESEGIKKIISILQLLIVVYNQSSITVAVDELDSGVFEYLLGELLRIISEKGKGQLIFTSHNLRPLETLDKGFIAFTTVNPKHRYIRFNNVKENNNLRDFYYRDIMLGEQNEMVYEPTNNAEISFAFREAGKAIGS
ncbi:MAG: ATP-binding protein [Fretibacterium sp.]|nr:ATP-binding protein [Fretibacterium sp.]